MCFVLYAGTDKPIPRREWREENPDVSVVSLTEREEPIRAHFNKPEIQYIGSTSGCGCDFPHVIFQGGGWPWFEATPDEEQQASDSSNRKALVDLLRQTEEKTIELYGLWDGDFAEAPKIRENISVATILDPEFRFKEQGFYTVQMNS